MAVYLNGALQAIVDAAATSVPVNSLPLRIGADNSGGSLLNGRGRRAQDLQPRDQRG